MSHAELCPVCGGSGQVWKSDPNTSSVGYYTSCHGCGGNGWVTIIDEGIVTPPCATCPWKPQEPFTPYEPWCSSYWVPSDDGTELWYTSNNITIRLKIEDSLEYQVDCGGLHPF